MYENNSQFFTSLRYTNFFYNLFSAERQPGAAHSYLTIALNLQIPSSSKFVDAPHLQNIFYHKKWRCSKGRHSAIVLKLLFPPIHLLFDNHLVNNIYKTYSMGLQFY